MIIAIGGAGINVATLLHKEGREVLALESDACSFNAHDIPKALIGKECAKGIGCCGDSALGTRAMQESLGEIEKYLGEEVTLVFGLGAGTGMGGAIVLAKTAKERGAKVNVYATYPFPEETRRIEKANKGIATLASFTDKFVIVPNQHKGGRWTGISEAMQRTDAQLARSIGT